MGQREEPMTERGPRTGALRRARRVDGGDDDRWHARPLGAGLLRVMLFLAPVLVAAPLGVGLDRLLATRPLGLRLTVVAVSCVLAAVVVERAARRWLPLQTLLRMSMLFPGRAPSRLAVARLGRDRAAVHRRLTQSVSADELAEAMLALVTALGRHDRRTRGHSERVRMITELMAIQLSLSTPDRDRLRWAALLHDIGKLEVAASVLSKPGTLDEREWLLVREHPTHGARLAGPFLDFLGEWAGGIEHHHERWDGGGYPHGLAGDRISRAGRVVAVVDAFETMTAARAYKRAGGTRAALTELSRCAGTQFDPVLVRAFLNIPLPQLWWATGPLGLLVQVPLIGGAQQTAAQLSASVAAGAGGTAAAAGTAAVIGIGSALGIPGAAATELPHALSSSEQAARPGAESDAGRERVPGDAATGLPHAPSPSEQAARPGVGSDAARERVPGQGVPLPRTTTGPGDVTPPTADGPSRVPSPPGPDPSPTTGPTGGPTTKPTTKAPLPVPTTLPLPTTSPITDVRLPTALPLVTEVPLPLTTALPAPLPTSVPLPLPSALPLPLPSQLPQPSTLPLVGGLLNKAVTPADED